jgi:hypothetical protein
MAWTSADVYTAPYLLYVISMVERLYLAEASKHYVLEHHGIPASFDRPTLRINM